MIAMIEEWIRMKAMHIPNMVDNLVYTGVLLIVIFILRWITVKLLCKKHCNQIQQFAAKKLMTSAYVLVGVIIFLAIWNDSSEYIIAFLGVITAGIAFALRDLLMDMIGWIYILWAAPFKIGDRIEVGGQIGDVIDVRLLHFSILEVGNRIGAEQSTGRIIQIPNLQVFGVPLANYEKGFKFIWNEIMVPIDRESDWEKAKEKIGAIVEAYTSQTIEDAKEQLQALEKSTAIYYNNLTPIIYTELKGTQVVLSIRYLCEPRKARVSEHQLWEAILKLVKEDDDIKLG